MKPYDLPSAEIIEILKGKGLLNLYHANTVLTSNTFMENGHLLSREYVEANALLQTPQYPVARLLEFQVVHITKRNPSKWSDGDVDASRYYMSSEEFRLGYSRGDFDSMLILPEIERIRLLGNLDHVYFDNPNLIWNDTKTDLCDEAIETLKTAAKVGGLAGKGIKIIKRTCDFHSCACRNQYRVAPNTEKVFRIKK